jgi:hypothetical protein
MIDNSVPRLIKLQYPLRHFQVQAAKEGAVIREKMTSVGLSLARGNPKVIRIIIRVHPHNLDYDSSPKLLIEEHIHYTNILLG